MPKDFKKYRYVDVPLPLDSSTLAALEQDAAQHHMSDHIGKVAGLRLADYYKMAERLGTYSLEGILAILPVSSLLASYSPDGASAGPGKQTSLHDEQDVEGLVEPSNQLQDNAEAASNFWNTL
jgi:hypothetical protein